MHAQASAISVPQFVVEVSHPHDADDSQDVRFVVGTAQEAAELFTDATGGDWRWVCDDLEIGDDAEHVDEETGRTVTAHQAGGRS